MEWICNCHSQVQGGSQKVMAICQRAYCQSQWRSRSRPRPKNHGGKEGGKIKVKAIAMAIMMMMKMMISECFNCKERHRQTERGREGMENQWNALFLHLHPTILSSESFCKP